MTVSPHTARSSVHICLTSFDSHQIWNKTPDSRVSKGERTHGGSKHPISQKKKIILKIARSTALNHFFELDNEQDCI